MLTKMWLLIAFPILLVSVLVLAHLRPLRENELAELAAERRAKHVAQYFSFSGTPVGPDLEFKRRMEPGGTFYNFHDQLCCFPLRVASWLKYKKHEWMVVGMEKDREITLVYANKGQDGTRVCLALPFERLAEIARANGYTSLLIFHNHPNPDPGTYSCAQPSKVDLDSSAARARVLNCHGMNLVEFVCERGVPHKYRFSPAEKFFPILGFAQALQRENGLSRLKNLSLHLERIF
jgi:hypothetical protein